MRKLFGKSPTRHPGANSGVSGSNPPPQQISSLDDDPTSGFIGREIPIIGQPFCLQSIIAEGAFGYVFRASCGPQQEVAVKRVAVQDRNGMDQVEREISILQTVSGHKNIAGIIGVQKYKLRNGGVEIFIGMELCDGGNLVDMMNKRYDTGRFNEHEVLHIFGDICEAVAHMHFKTPAVIHRDLKVENVLFQSGGIFKLCDFGSATTNAFQPMKSNIQLEQEDINSNTTLQYRAPEIVDLYLDYYVDEKIDIWALGCLLYKLCYYETPFGDNTRLMMDARVNIPSNSKYSRALNELILFMLNPNPDQRPGIYDVASRAFGMRSMPCPFPNVQRPPRPVKQLAAPKAQVASSRPKSPVLNFQVTENCTPEYEKAVEEYKRTGNARRERPKPKKISGTGHTVDAFAPRACASMPASNPSQNSSSGQARPSEASFWEDKSTNQFPPRQPDNNAKTSTSGAGTFGFDDDFGKLKIQSSANDNNWETSSVTSNQSNQSAVSSQASHGVGQNLSAGNLSSSQRVFSSSYGSLPSPSVRSKHDSKFNTIQGSRSRDKSGDTLDSPGARRRTPSYQGPNLNYTM
eukprot:Nk52_evm103s221 gene=Nk52_evmTU103s221